MNITSKKSISIIIFLCYIISDLLFLKTADRDYANIILLFSSTILFVFEVLFWGMLFLSSDGRERKSSVKLLFLGALAGVGLSRIFLISSPYVNDLLNANIVLAYIIGIIRVAFIFAAIMNIFYFFDTKNIFLIIISILNLVCAILIWVDFDSGINGIIRLIIGIAAVIFTVMFKNETFGESD